MPLSLSITPTFAPPVAVRSCRVHSTPRRGRSPQLSACASHRLSGRVVLLTGATGATGRLIAGALHARGAQVRALIRPATVRDTYRVAAVRDLCPDLQIAVGDLRHPDTLAAAVRGCHGCICASGTRNFEGNDPNRPEAVDLDGVRMLAELFTEVQLEADLVAMLTRKEGDGKLDEAKGEGRALPVTPLVESSRFVLISSLGVTRPDRFPQLEQMGSVLSYKAAGEDALRGSGCPFTVVRPGGLRNDPAGQSRLVVDQGDRMVGFVSRADVAEIAAEALFCDAATNVTFEVVAAEGAPSIIGSHLFDGLKQDCD